MLVAELGEDLVGVLAEQRRGVPDDVGVVGDDAGFAQVRERAGVGMAPFDEKAP